MNSSFSDETFPDDSRYVLRLVVVKVEGVLVPPPEKWVARLPDTTQDACFDPDSLFPEWARQLDRPQEKLREDLRTVASSGRLSVPDPLRSFLDEIRNHTPLRVAFLSAGPSEWVHTLEQELQLENLNDLIFGYDNYPHGTRRTLLQFLMNRFIAGKGRTLLMGRTLEDARIADREKTRFRSLSAPPDGAEDTSRWDWELSDLLSFVHEIKAED